MCDNLPQQAFLECTWGAFLKTLLLGHCGTACAGNTPALITDGNFGAGARQELNLPDTFLDSTSESGLGPADT